jgi:hypothetical protein
MMSRIKFYAGIFLVTSSTLMLQLIETRILSVILWYHLAFFAISMAMFGLTAGSVWIYLKRDRYTQKTMSYEPLAKIIRITGRHKATARPWES